MTEHTWNRADGVVICNLPDARVCTATSQRLSASSLPALSFFYQLLSFPLYAFFWCSWKITDEVHSLINVKSGSKSQSQSGKRIHRQSQTGQSWHCQSAGNQIWKAGELAGVARAGVVTTPEILAQSLHRALPSSSKWLQDGQACTRTDRPSHATEYWRFETRSRSHRTVRDRSSLHRSVFMGRAPLEVQWLLCHQNPCGFNIQHA